VPGTEDAMTWMVSDFGMQMTLSRKVPDHIRAGLGPFLGQSGRFRGFDIGSNLREGHLRHPSGGSSNHRRNSGSTLACTRPGSSQQHHSGNYGNMSSATLPHVWKSILEDETVQPGT